MAPWHFDQRRGRSSGRGLQLQYFSVDCRDRVSGRSDRFPYDDCFQVHASVAAYRNSTGRLAVCAGSLGKLLLAAHQLYIRYRNKPSSVLVLRGARCVCPGAGMVRCSDKATAEKVTPRGLQQPKASPGAGHTAWHQHRRDSAWLRNGEDREPDFRIYTPE